MSDDDLIRRGDALALVAGHLHRHAIAALPAVTVGVKPLVWHPDHGCEARGMGILYAMCETTPGLFAMTNPFHSEVDLPQTEMQAAAQADYEARILAALEPVTQPAPDAAAIREAVADLADFLDAKHKSHMTGLGRNPADYMSGYSIARDKASAILALITEKPHDRKT